MPTSRESSDPRHPIRVVSLRTGLSPDVLRVWERRYGVVTPSRSEGGQRLYSDDDIQRLTLLRRATDAGRAIRQVAELGNTQLLALLEEDSAAQAERARQASRPQAGPAADYLEAATEAVTQLEPRRLQLLLGQALMELGAQGFVDHVVTPMLRRIGERWHAGEITAAHEHAATTVVRRVLGWMADGFDPPHGAPLVLVTTPTGDQHELGAMLVGVLAATEGWRVSHLGANLPAADVAAAASQAGASVVALSAVYRDRSEDLVRYVDELRPGLRDDVAVVVGGAAAQAVSARLEAAGALYLDELASLRDYLRAQRGAAAN